MIFILSRVIFGIVSRCDCTLSHTHRDLNRGPIASRIIVGGKKAPSTGISLGSWDRSPWIPVSNPERYRGQVPSGPNT